MENKTPQINDWWGKHNMTTRVIAIIFAFAVVAVVGGMFLGYEINERVASDIIWAAVAIGLGVMVGLNGIDKLTEFLKTVRK